MATNEKFIRTPTMASGGITPEEKVKLDAYAEQWIAYAMRTEPIDHAKIVPVIERLYEVCGLKKPRVVIVPSPRVMAFAGGIASAIWWLRKNPKQNIFAATSAATRAATLDADIAPLVRFMLLCMDEWYRPVDGGNMWGAWICWMGACRDVLGLRLPEHERFAALEAAAIYLWRLSVDARGILHGVGFP